MSQTVSAVQRF